MNNKYEARIFPNGRVVCYERKDLDDAINAGKELLIVCNCHTGGFAEAIGATEEPKRIRYSDYIHEQMFTGKEMVRFHKIIFTEGEKIFDDNFDYATQYSSIYHCFYDGDKKMRVDEKTTARFLYKEQVKAMIEIGVLTEKALEYCIQAPIPVKSSVDCCSG